MRVACLWFSPPTLSDKIRHQMAGPIKLQSSNQIIGKMAEHCLRFSPQIAVRPQEAVFIEIGRCQKLYSESSFAARAQVLLRRLELRASLAFANEIPEALALAKYGAGSLVSLPLEALHEFADPFNRDFVVHPYIDKMVGSFQDLGLRTLKDFKKIPAPELSSRFGPIGLLCYQRVRGEMNLPWPRWKPEAVIREKTNFPCFEFYGEMEPLLFELKKQLDQIFQRLWARALKLQKLQVRIFCELSSQNQQPYREFIFDFLFAQSTTKTALLILKERLSRHFEKNALLTPIESLECTVLSTVPGDMTSRSLLDARDEKNEQWQSLMAQLQEAYGAENIFQAQLTEDRRPERSWKKVSRHISPTSLSNEWQGRIPLRPTHLIRPEPVEVMDGFLYLKHKSYRILQWRAANERISGGWFETAGDFNNSFDRDYYQAEIEGGVRVSLFQIREPVSVFENKECRQSEEGPIFQGAKSQFFLHGFFG